MPSSKRARTPQPTPARPNRSFRPQLTLLEDRSTPAAITTAGTAATIDLNGISVGEAVTITTTATGAITVASNQGVTLNGGASAGSQTFSGATTVQVTDSTSFNSLTFAASTVAYTAAFTVDLDNAPSVTTFTGLSNFGANALSVTTARNIVVNAGATVTTTSGGITLSANVGGATSGAFNGIDVLGQVTSVSGAVSLSGHGGDDSGGNQVGIQVSTGGSVTTTGSGSVTLAGTGGSTSGAANRGIVLDGGVVGTGGGAVSVTGTGGVGSGGANDGVLIQSGGQITAGGAGSVSVQGTGGSDGTVSGGGFNLGVLVTGSGAVITSSGGSVSVTGTGGGGGGGGNNYGVDVQSGGRISAGGAGSVSVQGTGGADGGVGNVGVLVTGTDAAITSGGGSVSVTGIGGGGTFQRGVEVNSDGVVSSGDNAAVTVTADSIELFSGTSVNAGGGTVTLRPLTLGLAIDVGGADLFGTTLGLSDADLDHVTAGTLVIGRADSASAIRVTTTVQPAVTPNLLLITALNIVVNAGASLTTVGNLALSANQQATPTSGLFAGIEVFGGSLSSTAGTVSLSGRGGTDPDGINYGVYLHQATGSASVVGGSVVITGTGGASDGASNHGVYLTGNSLVSSTGNGSVVVTGTGGGTGSLSSIGSVGVVVDSGSVITAGGLGSVVVTGSGGAGAGGGNVGVSVTGSGSQIASGGGAVVVTGSGGLSGADNVGVLVTAGAIASGGAVSVTGSGGPDSFGVRVLFGGTVASGGTAAVTLTADGIDLDATDAVIRAGASGTGSVTLRPNTAGTPINLGVDDTLSAGLRSLGLLDAELDRVFAGELVIGELIAGPLTVVAAITRPTATNVFLAGPSITFDAGLNTGGGSLVLTADPDVTPAAAGPDATASAVVFAFASDTNLRIDINGTTADTGYTQLNVAGALDVAGVNLVLGGEAIPSAADEFTIVSATSVTGTFAGLPNGAALSVNGVPFRIFYTPTAIILRANTAPANVSAGGPYAVAEGSGLTVSAAAATDADGDALTYTWDVNGDGTFGDEANGTVTDGGRTVTFSGIQMAALGLADGPLTVNAAVRVSDGAVGVTAFTTLTVTNVPPTITSFVVPPSGRVGEVVATSATATDPAGVNDPLTFMWVVTINGSLVASGAGPTFAFTPTVAATYSLSVSVSDGPEMGASAIASVVVTDVEPPPVPPVFTAPPLVFGNAGRVKVVYPNGTTRTLEPFPGFLGDVTVASADMNGDGVPEVVAGAGPGGGPHVVVFDGATGAVTASFFAFDPGFTGGVFVAATADGRVITGAGAFGGPQVKVIAYARTGQTLPNGQIADSALVTTFFAYDQSFIGGVRVAAADETGDGVADVVTAAGPGGGPHVRVFDGVTYAEVRSFYAFAPDFAGGVYIAATNGWMAAGAGTWGGPHVRVFDSTGGERLNYFAYPADFIGGVRVAFADVDADGAPDVITAPGLGGGQPVTATRLSDLSTIASIAPFDPIDPLGVFVG